MAAIEKPHRLAGGVGELNKLSMRMSQSAEADLGQDALTGEQLSAQADDETHHGQAAVPGLSEVDEAEAGCVVRHGSISVTSTNVTNNGVLLPVVNATLRPLLGLASGGRGHR